jgi:hypothetical protein
MQVPIAQVKAARVMLSRVRASRTERNETPLLWQEFLDNLSERRTGRASRSLSLWDVLFGRATMFAWNPSLEAWLSTFGRGGMVYLCWGVPKRSGIKKYFFNFFLNRARHVLVNDETTRREIFGLTGRQADIVPFFVDGSYFTFATFNGRQNFYFCNGSNDRDPELLMGLAKRGFKIVWLVNDRQLYDQYHDKDPSLELRKNLSFAELRNCYQQCRAAIMPVKQDVHCAGQTTGLEALLCGAPLVISESRTASIFASLPSVVTLAKNAVENWSDALSEIDPMQMSKATARTRQLVQEKVAPMTVERELSAYFSMKNEPQKVHSMSNDNV